MSRGARPRALALRAALFAVLARCTGGGGGDAGVDAGPLCNGATATASVAVGSTSQENPTVYRMLSDGDAVQLTAGIQGGQHVFLRLRAQGICPQRPGARVRAFRVSDDRPVAFAPQQGLTWTAAPDLPGAFLSPTFQLPIDDPYYCSVLGCDRLRIEVAFDDGAGHLATQTVTVHVDGWSPESVQEMVAGRISCCADPTNQRCYPQGPPDSGVACRADAAAVADAATEAGAD